MGKEILQKYTIFEVKRQLAEMEKQYGKERVTEMLGEGRVAEIDREFKKAVTATRELVLNKHFNYIHPHRAAIRFGELLNGSDELTEWAVLVKQFEIETDFETFFSARVDYYDGVLKDIGVCPLDKCKEYTDNYFHKSADLQLIICPLDGNYGFVQCGNAYAIRCHPYFSENGKAPFSVSSFAKGIAHEYAHCFVNQIVEANKDLLNGYTSFFRQHKNMASYYNVNYAVINEYFVRAFAIRFMENMRFENFDISEEYVRQRKMFIFIDRFVEFLKNYERSKYSFRDFYLSNLSNLLQ